MELNEATRKRACAGTSSLAGSPDRLSALPDCLLHAIMSFMKARQAVQTCVLSTRWRHLWRSVPCLNVDLDEFKTAARAFAYNSEWEDFEDFAINLMLRRNIALLDSFSLDVRGGIYSFGSRQAAAGLVRRAMKYCAPDPVIQREGLSSSSWRLKSLHLYGVVLDIRFAKHVSSVCHLLEDLELEDCTSEIQSIASHSLKNLVLKNCKRSKLSEITSPTLKTLVIDGGGNEYGHLLVILAPAVAYLLLAVRFYLYSGGISINEMPSLAKASIHLRDIVLQSKLGCDLFKLLCSVSNATSLEFSGFGMMVLGKESTLQEFKNLRNLLLDNCDLSDDFQTLGLFLRKSPNLEKLTLQRCKFSNDSKKKKGTPKSKKV